MKFSAVFAAIGLLNTTQACVRISVNEIWSSSTERTRELKLWDNDDVNGEAMSFYGRGEHGDYYAIGNRYYVFLNWNNDGGFVVYPNGYENKITQRARRQTTTSDGRTQIFYCMWDNYSNCGNYVCGLP
ncbi:hypothetical protein PspLS_00102 [Pyricularia sp. CBS 133598]|nr:hypothetical protein PspLS_00102 [Pyricularia sp. CBS 133598]